MEKKMLCLYRSVGKEKEKDAGQLSFRAVEEPLSRYSDRPPKEIPHAASP
jgi:hypothetical protein